jgi:hypothetical protein
MVVSVKRADLAGFDAALSAGEPEFVKRRIYLTLERGRDIVLRNLLRKVYIAGGFEPLKEGQTDADATRRTRIPVAEFAAAMRLSLGQNSGEILDDDEVECMLANMIYKVPYPSCIPSTFFLFDVAGGKICCYRGRCSQLMPWASQNLDL